MENRCENECIQYRRKLHDTISILADCKEQGEGFKHIITFNVTPGYARLK